MLFRSHAVMEKERSAHAELVATLQAQVDEHKATAGQTAARLAELEESHARIIMQVEADAEARQLTEKELVTHRSLVSNLENQVEEHKSALELHQQSLESLQQSHTLELEKLSAELASKQSATRELESDLNRSKADLEGLLKGIGSALNEETNMYTVQAKIQALTEERSSLTTEIEQADRKSTRLNSSHWE